MTEQWQSMAKLGFSSYEASTEGRYRSVDRTAGSRQLKGKVLATRVSNRGYVLVNLTGDDGRKVTRTGHTLTLGTFDGPCPPGQQARHLDDDPLNNAWAPGDTREERMAAGGNLMYGTPADNNGDKVLNGNRVARPPKPARECVRCEAPFAGNGRRCHACVVWIGQEAARQLLAGSTLADACRRLEYPSAEGLHTLAVKYGGYGAQPPRSWLRRVTATLRERLSGGDRA